MNIFERHKIVNKRLLIFHFYFYTVNIQLHTMIFKIDFFRHQQVTSQYINIEYSRTKQLTVNTQCTVSHLEVFRVLQRFF